MPALRVIGSCSPLSTLWAQEPDMKIDPAPPPPVLMSSYEVWKKQ
jgi:hypothetical protein